MIACTRDFPRSEDGANNFATFVCRVQYDTPLLTTQADAYNALFLTFFFIANCQFFLSAFFLGPFRERNFFLNSFGLRV